MANRTTNDVYEFGSLRLDADQRVLTRDNQRVPLTPKTFDLLLLFVRSPGRAFSRNELITDLWPDTVVEEANLSYQISLLRKALGEDGGWIETVQKHGYRFSADVDVVSAGGHVSPDLQPRGLQSAADEATSPPITTRHGTRFLLWSGAAAAVLALAVFLIVRQGRQAQPGQRGDSVPVPLTAYPGSETEPSLSPDGSQVAFVWNGPRQDNSDIYVKLVGPGEPLRLTTAPQDDDSPAWSPDGRTIAFLRVTQDSNSGARTAAQGEVFVMPALGGAERRIATMAVPPQRWFRELSWSPDGRWLLLGGAPSANEPFGLWLLEVNGSERRRLTSGSAQTWQFDAAPQFSPDGQRIAFIRHRTSSHALFTLSLSPALTPAGRPVQVKTDRGQELRDLAWSPDGTRLFYSSGGHSAPTRLRVVPMSGAAPASVPQLLSFGDGATTITVGHTGRVVYSAEFWDTNLWRLDVSRPDSAPEDAGIPQSTLDDHTPAYSSNGKRVAFSSTRSGSDELWIANVDGTGLRQVTSTGGPVCSNPQWAPDDRVIVFDSEREGSRDLYLLTPETLELRRLTQDPAVELEPYWSRDGRWIYFGSDRTGQFETWKMPREGGAAIQVTRNGGIDAQESPDGRFLYYAKLNMPTTLWRMPIGGGDAVQIADRLSYPRNYVVSTAGIYLVAPGDRPNTMSIDFLDARTGRRSTRATINKDWGFGLALSPDQRWLLFSVVERAGADLMSVDTTP